MQSNLRVVVNKVNVVVISVVVVVVLVLTVVSIVRVIGVIDSVSPGIAIEKAEIIKAVPEDNGIANITGVVVDPVVVNPVYVGTGVPPVVKSPIDFGYMDASLDLGDAHIANGISRLAESSDIITIASADQGEIYEIRASIDGIESVNAGTVSGIGTAPITGDCINGLKTSITRIQIQVAEGISNDGITDIAAASINGRSDDIGLIS